MALARAECPREAGEQRGNDAHGRACGALPVCPPPPPLLIAPPAGSSAAHAPPPWPLLHRAPRDPHSLPHLLHQWGGGALVGHAHPTHHPYAPACPSCARPPTAPPRGPPRTAGRRRCRAAAGVAVHGRHLHPAPLPIPTGKLNGRRPPRPRGGAGGRQKDKKKNKEEKKGPSRGTAAVWGVRGEGGEREGGAR